MWILIWFCFSFETQFLFLISKESAGWGEDHVVLASISLLASCITFQYWCHSCDIKQFTPSVEPLEKLKGEVKDPANFWKGLDSPLPHCIFPSPLHQSLSCQPLPCTALTQLKITARALSICSHPTWCCAGQPLVVFWCTMQRGVQRTDLRIRAIFMSKHFSRSVQFLWGFQIHGLQGNPAVHSWLIGCIIYNITDTQWIFLLQTK